MAQTFQGFQPGDRLDERYEIVDTIGQGGFGIVYRARQIAIDRIVALKVLLPEADTVDPQAVERFRREAVLISSLESPNTITLYEFGQTDNGLLYTVMEFARGKTLRQILATEGAVPPNRVVRVIKQCLQSLQEAHQRGVIHRDLKPANIMVGEYAGQQDHVKVLDFGIAKVLKSGDTQSTLALTGRIVGTPRYMAPEQLRGINPTPACDLYALGLIMFEMLTGGPAVTAVEPMDQVQAQMAPDPFVLPPVAGLPASLAANVAKALEKDPSKRFQSAAEFAKALETSDRIVVPDVNAELKTKLMTGQEVQQIVANHEAQRASTQSQSQSHGHGQPPQAHVPHQQQAHSSQQIQHAHQQRQRQAHPSQQTPHYAPHGQPPAHQPQYPSSRVTNEQAPKSSLGAFIMVFAILFLLALSGVAYLLIFAEQPVPGGTDAGAENTADMTAAPDAVEPDAGTLETPDALAQQGDALAPDLAGLQGAPDVEVDGAVVPVPDAAITPDVPPQPDAAPEADAQAALQPDQTTQPDVTAGVDVVAPDLGTPAPDAALAQADATAAPDAGPDPQTPDTAAAEDDAAQADVVQVAEADAAQSEADTVAAVEQPATTPVEVISNPAGATVTWEPDGSCTSPCEVPVPAEGVRIRVRRSGHRSARPTLTPDDAPSITVNLRRRVPDDDDDGPSIPLID